MEQEKKSNLILILGLAIPFVVIVLIAIVTLIPKSSIEAKHDFLYYFRDYKNSYCLRDGIYTVSKNKIKITDNIVQNDPNCKYDLETDPPKIYRYDVERDTFYQISLEDAQKLNIDNNTISPDGISVRRGDYYNAGIFEIFGGVNRNNNRMTITDNKGNAEPIEIGFSNYYDFIFIGWVI